MQSLSPLEQLAVDAFIAALETCREEGVELPGDIWAIAQSPEQHVSDLSKIVKRYPQLNAAYQTARKLLRKVEAERHKRMSTLDQAQLEPIQSLSGRFTNASRLPWKKDVETAGTNNSKTSRDRGAALMTLGRYEEAIASFDQALQDQPSDADAWSNRGVALLSLERYEEAIASFDQALHYKPSTPEIWDRRGTALAKLERYEEAIASFDQALQNRPDNSKESSTATSTPSVTPASPVNAPANSPPAQPSSSDSDDNLKTSRFLPLGSSPKASSSSPIQPIIYRYTLPDTASPQAAIAFSKQVETIRHSNPDWVVSFDRPNPGEADAIVLIHKDEYYATTHAAYLANQTLNRVVGPALARIFGAISA